MNPSVQTTIMITPNDEADKFYEGVGTHLITQFGNYSKEQRLGAAYDPDETAQIGTRKRPPKILLLSAAIIPQEGEAWLIVPDLAIEVISPKDTWEKVNRQRREYFAAGVHQVWLISLEARAVHIYDSPKAGRVLTEEDELTSEALLPGFRCRVSELFQQPAHS